MHVRSDISSIGFAGRAPRAAWATLLSATLLGGCFWGDENDWASRGQIIAAAARCGVPDFEPTEAGAAYAAYVSPSVPDARQKEDCIYKDLQAQGLMVTR